MLDPTAADDVRAASLGFFASVALFYGISFATQPVSGQRRQQFHGYLDQTFSTAREPLPTTATPASGTSAT